VLIEDSSRKNNLNFIKGILMICVNFFIIIFPERHYFDTAPCMWIMHGNECTLPYLTMQGYVLIC
jgi:hypothetical protein